jgi:hypothetical protein
MNGGLNTHLLQATVRGAVYYAQSVGGGATPTSVLQQVLVGHYTWTTKNGRMLISVSEAGGSSTWALPPGIGPEEVASYASEALSLLEELADPDNPNLATMFKRCTRLRASFQSARV